MSSTTPRIYREGDEVPFRFDPGIIVASYFVSLVGCISAVELLHRKRRGKGWVRWISQLGIAVSFGLVSIWCMHFVGNRAIILGDGRKELQLFYNPGFTALSVFLPIIFLFFGFTLVELRQPSEKSFWPFLIVSGVIAGLAITGMHYIGNFGISNYRLANPAQFIVGAAAIAVVASITALALFFFFHERWINSWPRRVVCACVLAGAVSGMHWVASVGTKYTLIQTSGNTQNRDVNLIIAIICSLLACVVCLVFAFVTQRRRKHLADRAQHVVLASATFDQDGRMLVTQEGLPPCRKVTKQFNQKSFDDEFNTAHPVFQWLYRVTFNWAGVTDLIPGMRSHLRAVGFMKDRHSRPSTQGSLSTYEESENDNDYSIVFREYFCIAADELADQLDTPLNDLGVLFPAILTTGSMSTDLNVKKGRKGLKGNHSDLETGLVYPSIFGKGQLLFVARTVDKTESAKLISAGYRFTNARNVSEIISKAMRVPHHDITETLDRLHVYAQPHAPLDTAGSYLACFALRANLKAGNRSWEILVPTDAPGDLPKVELSPGPLKPWQLSRLARLDGFSVSQCIGYLNNTVYESSQVEEKEFTEFLLDQITELTKQVPEEFFKQAVFSAEPVRVPGLGEDRDGSSPQIFAFCIIPDVHSASVKSPAVTYVPLSFFQCIQRVYRHSPDHAILAQRIHREFSSILSHKDVAAYTQRAPNHRASTRRASRLSIPSVSFSKGNSPRDSTTPVAERDSSMDKDDLISRSESGNSPPPSALAFGGIMVSSDTKIEVHDKDGRVEMSDLGTHAEAGVARESPTYVDDLFRIASARWQRQ